MSIIEGLQRIMKGDDRASCESASQVKELSQVEDSAQPELISKLSDSSGYLHWPTAEWLASYIDDKGGARLIGVEDDSFSVLTGDGDLQTLIKALDTFLTETTADLTVDMSTPFGGSTEQDWRFKLWRNQVRVVLDDLSETVDLGAGGNAYLEFTLPASYGTTYQPDADCICPIIFTRDGTTEAGYIKFYSGSNAARIYRVSDNFYDSDSVVWEPQTLSYDINNSIT